MTRILLFLLLPTVLMPFCRSLVWAEGGTLVLMGQVLSEKIAEAEEDQASMAMAFCKGSMDQTLLRHCQLSAEIVREKQLKLPKPSVDNGGVKISLYQRRPTN